MKLHADRGVLSSLASALTHIGLGVAFAKVLALLSFFAAASYLSSEQIGIYSYTLGAFGLLLCYQAGSVGQLVIQRAVFKRESLEPYLSYASISNIVMVGIAGAYLAFESPTTASVILIALAMMLNGLVSAGQTFHRAKLVSDLNFRAAALVDGGLAAIQCVSFLIALFILRDERAYAFSFFGLFVGNLSLLLWGGYFIRPRYKQAQAIFTDARHLVASSISGQATFFLPLFLVSRNTDVAVGAQFYFASQLIMAFGLLAQKPIQSSILPLTKIIQDHSDDGLNIMSSALVKVGVIFCIMSVCLGFILDDIILYIWEEKWLAAGSVVHFALVAMVIKVFTSAQIGLVEAEGHWRVKNYLSFFELSAVLLASIYAVNLASSLYELAYLIFLSHSVANLVSQVVIGKILGIRMLINLLAQISFAVLVIAYA
jgi:hypothetical protein